MLRIGVAALWRDLTSMGCTAAWLSLGKGHSNGQAGRAGPTCCHPGFCFTARELRMSCLGQTCPRRPSGTLPRLSF